MSIPSAFGWFELASDILYFEMCKIEENRRIDYLNKTKKKEKMTDLISLLAVRLKIII